MTNDEIAAAKLCVGATRLGLHEVRDVELREMIEIMCNTIDDLCDEVERLQRTSRLSPQVWDLLTAHLRSTTRWDSEGYSRAKEEDMAEGGNRHVKEYLSNHPDPVFIEINEASGTWTYTRAEP